MPSGTETSHNGVLMATSSRHFGQPWVLIRSNEKLTTNTSARCYINYFTISGNSFQSVKRIVNKTFEKQTFFSYWDSRKHWVAVVSRSTLNNFQRWIFAFSDPVDFFGVSAEPRCEMVPGRLLVAFLQDRSCHVRRPIRWFTQKYCSSRHTSHNFNGFHQSGCCLVWF